MDSLQRVATAAVQEQEARGTTRPPIDISAEALANKSREVYAWAEANFADRADRIEAHTAKMDEFQRTGRVVLPGITQGVEAVTRPIAAEADIQSEPARADKIRRRRADRPAAKSADKPDAVDTAHHLDTLDLSELLGIPGLQPEPAKPLKQVTIDVPDMGSFSVRFHWAIAGEKGVWLIYDTRWSDDALFTPAANGRLIRLYLSDETAINVCFTGIRVRFGCFLLMYMPRMTPPPAAPAVEQYDGSEYDAKTGLSSSAIT